MKIAGISIGNNTIDTYNNMWTGIEKVYFNGCPVSKQFNWFVGIHEFQVTADDGVNTDYYRVEFRIDFSSTQYIKTDIFRNGECVLNQTGKYHRYAANALPVFSDHKAPHDDRKQRKENIAASLYREEDLV
ncbi:MAG: hypothetical protein OTI34_12165 [Lewinella sp.]|nr:hypothetical protein [Lewinella sp.]